jgi:hypothetical protein
MSHPKPVEHFWERDVPCKGFLYCYREEVPCKGFLYCYREEEGGEWKSVFLSDFHLTEIEGWIGRWYTKPPEKKHETTD